MRGLERVGSDAKRLVRVRRVGAHREASLFNTVQDVQRVHLSLKQTPDRSCGDGHHARGRCSFCDTPNESTLMNFDYGGIVVQ